MQQIILSIHLIAALLLVGLILAQRGKGSDMGAAFGSGASQTVFGSQGSTSFLVKIIATLVAIFFMTSVSLNYFIARSIAAEKIANTPQVLLPHDDQGIIKGVMNNSHSSNSNKNLSANQENQKKSTK